MKKIFRSLFWIFFALEFLVALLTKNNYICDILSLLAWTSILLGFVFSKGYKASFSFKIFDLIFLVLVYLLLFSLCFYFMFEPHTFTITWVIKICYLLFMLVCNIASCVRWKRELRENQKNS